MCSTAAALALFLVADVAAQVVNTTRGPRTSTMPLDMTTAFPRFLAAQPKLDRAHRNKLLVEAPCAQLCSSVIWEIKTKEEGTWKAANADAHANFPDTFYVRDLFPDTVYVLRALLKPPFGSPYRGDDVPTLEARTCPDQPPPVDNLRVHSAGPGWLEVRWTPPPKEQCKSHLYYQARYAQHGFYFSAWRQYGFFRSDRWVHFHPTHPCAVWPAEFCLLLADAVKAGEQHVVEVRVSRFDELPQAVSESRKVVARAETACLMRGSCGVIGAAPATATANANANASSTASANASSTAAPWPNADEVDVDDADIPTTPRPPLTSYEPTELVTKAYTRGVSEAAGAGAGTGAGAAARRAAPAPQPAGDSAFGRMAPVFLALLLLALAAAPAAFWWGKRRGAREAVELHMVPAWRRGRPGGDGGSQPVLSEELGEDETDQQASGTTLEVDHHGRYSWAKLLPRDD